MTAPTDQPLVGDIIEVEYTEDYTATAPTWNLVGHTTDTVELSPNPENAEIRQHGEFQMDKGAVSEAWEIAFSKKIVSGDGALDILNLLTQNSAMKGYSDTREIGDTAPALRISVYASEADRDAGTVKYQVATDDYLLLRGGGEINVEEFALVEMTIHSRVRPIRMDLGGTLGATA